LFTPDGCKVDSPKPACGYASLVEFCLNANGSFNTFAYTVRGQVISSNVADTIQVLAGFLLAGQLKTDNSVIAQSGFNGFVLRASDGLIESCTGYLADKTSSAE
jgi:hypothetical protein